MIAALPDGYNFELLLIFLSQWRHPSIDVVHQGAYRRILRSGDKLTLVEAKLSTPATLSARILASNGPFDAEKVMQALALVLGLDADLPRFWTWARAHRDLWPAVAPVEGLTLPRTETLYEALVFTIIEQQIAWTAAQRAQKLLCEWGGEGLEYENVTYYAVPSPERLAAAETAVLKPLKITDRRAGLLIRIADEVAAGRLELEALRSLTPPERYAQLTAIKGVGHWTAVMALSRAYGTHPATASNDVALRSAVKLYLPQFAEAADPIAAAFADCGEFAGPAAMFLLSRYVIDRY